MSHTAQFLNALLPRLDENYSQSFYNYIKKEGWSKRKEHIYYDWCCAMQENRNPNKPKSLTSEDYSEVDNHLAIPYCRDIYGVRVGTPVRIQGKITKVKEIEARKNAIYLIAHLDIEGAIPGTEIFAINVESNEYTIVSELEMRFEADHENSEYIYIQRPKDKIGSRLISKVLLTTSKDKSTIRFNYKSTEGAYVEIEAVISEMSLSGMPGCYFLPDGTQIIFLKSVRGFE